MKLEPNYKNKHILVLGLGISGRSAAKFLLDKGAIVTGVDQNFDTLNSLEILNLKKNGLITQLDTEPCDVDKFDLIIVSPGISHSHPIYEKALQLGIEVIGEVELACRFITQKCLAITGTNGKTTVTLMVAHVLNQAGIPARALGNVGTPLTSVINEHSNPDEIFVIELSSFQLDTLQTRFVDAGVILNVTPDHLDRYGTLEIYAQSKLHLYDLLKQQGVLLVEDRIKTEFPALCLGRHLPSYGYNNDCEIYCDKHSVFINQLKVFELPLNLQGKIIHDVENLMAAYFLCQYVGVLPEQFMTAIESFRKPAHRIEYIRTISGVNYYDDSKGTNIDAVIRAVDTFESQIILIAGGVDKGASYTLWLETIAKKLKLICAIGKAKDKIKHELGQHIPVILFETLDDAVLYASEASEFGDTVLLSPGCSSYDMFKDYVHRGNEFQRIVNKL